MTQYRELMDLPLPPRWDTSVCVHFIKLKTGEGKKNNICSFLVGAIRIPLARQIRVINHHKGSKLTGTQAILSQDYPCCDAACE